MSFSFSPMKASVNEKKISIQKLAYKPFNDILRIFLFVIPFIFVKGGIWRPTAVYLLI